MSQIKMTPALQAALIKLRDADALDVVRRNASSPHRVQFKRASQKRAEAVEALCEILRDDAKPVAHVERVTRLLELPGMLDYLDEDEGAA